MRQQLDVSSLNSPRVHHVLLRHSHKGQELHLCQKKLTLAPLQDALGLLLLPPRGGPGSHWDL